jgi:hypothetical protein
VVPLVTAASLATLSTLAHGGGGFALPIFGGLALALLLTQPPDRRPLVRSWLLPAVAAVGAVVLLTAPWSAYGTWADPNHDRLLKLHLAGYAEVDDRPILAVLREAYGALSLREIVDVRMANLRNIVDPQLSTYMAHDTPDWLLPWRLRDFSRPIAAMCLGSALAACFAVLTVVRMPRTRRDGPTGRWWPATWLVWLCLLSIVGWAAAIFSLGGTVVHTGSFTWLLILAAVPFGFLSDKSRWGVMAAVLVLLAQAAYSSYVYWSMAAHVALPLPTPPPPQVMADSMPRAIALGTLGVIASVVVEWRRRQAPEADGQA